MAFHTVYGATIVIAALTMAEPAGAQQRRDGNLLPQNQSGRVTAVGCLVKGDKVRGGQADKYVLARPRKGPVESVPEATCTAEVGGNALTLDNPEKASIKDSMLGKWVEVSGRLESETDKNPDNLRELDVLTAKMVPVVVPPAPTASTPARPAAQAPESRPSPQPSAAPTPTAPAAAPAEPRKLPKTASQLPAIGLAGLLLVAAGVMLRSRRLRHAA